MSKKKNISIAEKKQSNKMGYMKKNIFPAWQLYLMLVLPLIYLLVFCYYPMLGAQIAFKDYRISQGIWGSEWVGFEYFERFFTSYQFERVLKNTLVLSFYQLVAGFPLPIILALLLNSVRSERYKKVVQLVTYIPNFISTIVIVGMLNQFFNTRIGVYGIMYTAITGESAPELLGSAAAFSHLYVWSGIWQTLGWSSIIFLAALTAVDLELHEAATIDGATRFQRVRYLDLPAVLPTATIMLILNAGRIMSIGFEKVYLMQNALNISASQIISTYVYDVALGSGNDFSYATAIGLFNSVVNLILLCGVNFISKKFSETSLW